MNLSIVTTADGSKSIYNAEVGENYHSKHGALQESKHVFLNTGLKHFLAAADAKQASVLEVGFGTGLNFLLTADYCTSEQIKLNYTGIEAYPLSPEMIAQTGYNEYVPGHIWSGLQQNYQEALQNPVQLNNFTELHIAHTQLLNYATDQQFNVIYFDAFAAIHQPHMWNEEAIGHTVKYLAPGGVFVTYAITGNLKRMLKGMGLKVEKAPGAPGKREMLRATKPL
ncbi:tRNA (5-methylaminomethyl-2-thiouridine)(34)-methyltransferase MnmD [Mucilaginibacter terrae]|uniref:tRNA U34 5-methylaminomethyl-2-thiouridine-forming methyltransferase MnmC n=1 Tax=Mucilaginibacter terrae TaxID=1955052 RepID=A0ABU3H079_9SPHI|nr:tRNA (5-methylaminomethyl-2-thiouridine)(34)-methyltransferase MnmD [Mucilaginibacter terrae]MDT3405418.1 tRNA U34 5-methylaminomethyl-2-thiouridine-forming methyltransferase MnmC [Mucilaginibacter terrae]